MTSIYSLENDSQSCMEDVFGGSRLQDRRSWVTWVLLHNNICHAHEVRTCILYDVRRNLDNSPLQSDVAIR
jgi:hypothetical protein